jgi:hypothetical protein
MTKTGLAHDYHAHLIVNILKLRPDTSWTETCDFASSCPCIERVMDLLPHYKWYEPAIVINQSISIIRLFERFPGMQKNAICLRHDVTFDEILTMMKEYTLDWWFITSNHHIVNSYDLIEQYPDLPWKISAMAFNRCLNTDHRFFNMLVRFVNNECNPIWNKNHVDLLWDHLSAVAPLQTVHRFPQLSWDQTIIRYRENPSLRPQTSMYYCDLQYIIDHPNEPWDWYAVTCRNDITPQVVEQHPHLPWVQEILQRHFCTPQDFITRPKDWMPLPRKSAYKHLFSFQNEIQEFAIRHMAAWRIQQAFLKALYDPKMLICQRKINRWSQDAIIMDCRR